MPRFLFRYVAVLCAFIAGLTSSPSLLFAQEEKAPVRHDGAGVWFIQGATLADLHEQMGYEIASARLYQLELFRLAGQGRLAAFFGSSLLEVDVFTRVTGYSSTELEQGFATMDADARTVIQAYANGINRRLLEVSQNPELIPFEWQARGWTAEPWTTTDVTATVIWLLRRMDPTVYQFAQLQAAGDLQRLMSRFGEQGPGLFEDLYFLNDPSAPTQIEETETSRRKQPHREKKPWLGQLRTDIDFQIAANQWFANAAKRRNALSGIGIEIENGGYAWLMSGQKSLTGNPLLYGGPNLGTAAPSPVVEGSMQGPLLQVSGMTIPGLPFFLQGRTSNHTWAMTAGHAHSVDLYLEDGSVLQGEPHRVEQIEVYGQEPVSLEIYRGEHGPIIQSQPVLAWKYAGWGYEFNAVSAYLDLTRADSLDTFSDAVGRLPYSNHVYYGDREGNIAYWMSGRDPIRPQGEFRLPQGAFGPVLEWDATQIRELVHERNPRKGFFAGWGNKAHPDYPNTPGFVFGPFHRAHYLYETLEERGIWSLNQLRDVGLTVSLTDSFAAGGNPWTFVADAFYEALATVDDPRFDAAIAILDEWDGHLVAGRPVAWTTTKDRSDGWMLMDAWVRKVLEKTFDEVPGLSKNQQFNTLLHGLYPQAGFSNLYDWFQNTSDPNAPQTAAGIIISALEECLNELGQRPWGKDRRGTLDFRHPALWNMARVPFANRATYAQAVAMSPDGPERIQSFFPLGSSGMITANAFSGIPVLDPLFTAMRPYYDHWQMRDFPNFHGDSAPDLLSRVVAALGGETRILNTAGRYVVAEGQNYAGAQAFVPGDWSQAVAFYRYTMTHDLLNNRFHVRWLRDIDFPEDITMNYVEVWDHDRKEGYIDGRRLIFYDLEREVMYEKHMTFMNKRNLVSTPHLLIREALQQPENVVALEDRIFEGKAFHILRINQLYTMPVDIYVDPETHLPRKVETLEDDWAYGDTLAETRFESYREVDGIQEATVLNHYIRGLLLQTEVRDQIAHDPPIDDAMYILPEPEDIPPAYLDFFPENPRIGTFLGDVRANQFLQYAGHGVPFPEIDFIRTGHALVNLQNPIASGIFLIATTTHNVLVMEMSDYLIVAAPSGYPQVMELVVNKIKQRFPNKPIRYVVLAHAHLDHIGGLRTLIAEGATVITRRENEHIVRGMYDAAHTVIPDRLSQDPKPLEMWLIDGKTRLEDSRYNLEFIPWDSPHSAGTMFLHVPQLGLIYTDDEIVPGFFSPDLLNKDPTDPMPQDHLDWGSKLVYEVLPVHGIEPKLFAGGHGVAATLEELLIAFSRSPADFKHRGTCR